MARELLSFLEERVGERMCPAMDRRDTNASLGYGRCRRSPAAISLDTATERGPAVGRIAPSPVRYMAPIHDRDRFPVTCGSARGPGGPRGGRSYIHLQTDLAAPCITIPASPLGRQ